MKRIDTEIEIDAPPDTVWAALVDFPGHAAWNPFIREISGEAVVGARLTAVIAPPGGKPMTFRPTVTVADAPRELRWVGRVLMPGLFDGEHWFRIEPREGGSTLHHGEQFTGMLVPLVMREGMFKQTRFGFEVMNRALRNHLTG